MKKPSKVKEVFVFDHKLDEQREDSVAIEEPLQITIAYGPQEIRKKKDLAITMRTPGDDMNLVLGFLLTEGIVQQPNDCLQIKQIADNHVLAELNASVSFEEKQLDRNFYMTSSCGVCGKASLEAVQAQSDFIAKKDFTVTCEMLLSLVDKIQNQQSAFIQTGGIHASTLFDQEGSVLVIKEDVGRHNATDKLVGSIWKKNKALFGQSILLLSGRASFELIQKATMAGIPIVCSIGAPSSLAIELAEAHGICLIGFLKATRFNVYANPDFILH